MILHSIFISFLAFYFASGSSLTQPPQSALVIAFEKSYEQSLLAYTLSDQGIDSTLVVSSLHHDKLYENLQGIEIIKLNVSAQSSVDTESLSACQALLGDQKILKRVGEIQPTFVLFPALRHDACILPWAKFISSIPVIVTYGPDEDLYAVQRTHIALPLHTGGLWSGFWQSADSRSTIAYADSNFVVPALKLAKQQMPELQIDFEELYSSVELILNAGDDILRSDFARISQQPIHIGCHHCRGAHPLPHMLQKELVEFRSGTIAATLDESFRSLIEEIARKLPQGRQGQAVAWKNSKVKFDDESKPENLFVHGEVDRQDLVGYARTRVLLSHCGDTELLETAFHGTPVICFPRNIHEQLNTARVIQLGFSLSTNGDTSAENVLAMIDDIHKTASYREAARGVSLVIRDRPLPSSDRLIYWLSYIARNSDRTFKFPGLKATDVRTFAEVAQLFSGLLVGMVLGVLATLGFIFAWITTKNSHKQIRKEKRFNR